MNLEFQQLQDLLLETCLMNPNLSSPDDIKSLLLKDERSLAYRKWIEEIDDRALCCMREIILEWAQKKS